MIGKINSEIFILGMGISGISLAKYLIKKKYQLHVGMIIQKKEKLLTH